MLARKITTSSAKCSKTTTKSAILSRSFCNTEEVKDIIEIERIFQTNMLEVRKFEKLLLSFTKQQYTENLQIIDECVRKIVEEK